MVSSYHWKLESTYNCIQVVQRRHTSVHLYTGGSFRHAMEMSPYILACLRGMMQVVTAVDFQVPWR